MTLEELLHKRFQDSVEISEMLAKYNNRSAIFYQFSPDDRQRGWDILQYPRIIYSIDMQANKERSSVGVMDISIYCTEDGIQPEEVEVEVRKCLRDLLVIPNKSYPYCFAWSRTDAFEFKEKEVGADTKVIGTELRFDILEYPNQETCDPDPTMAVARYIKDKLPEALVLGIDINLGNFIETGIDKPVFYCRLDAVDKKRETNNVVEMEAKIAIHAICPHAETRLKLIAYINSVLALDGEINMLDNSPMRILRQQLNNRADYLTEGQLHITSLFGLLRYQEQKPKLMQINTNVGGI